MVLAALAVACSGTLLAGCLPTGPPSPSPPGTTSARSPSAGPSGSAGVAWAAPGLTDRAGEPFEVPVPGPASGLSLDVTDYGADPDPDSGDDAAAIRAALDAAEAGDEVLLPAGTFDLRSTDPGDDTANIVLRSGIDLRGAGRDRTVLLSSLDGAEGSTVLRGAGIEDVRLTGLTITSTVVGPPGQDTEDSEAGGGPAFGIHLGARAGRGSARVLVEDVSVSRFERHGISVKSSREVTLRGNHLAEATGVGPGGRGYGIAVEGPVEPVAAGADTDSRHHQVIGNTFEGQHLRHAILLQFATHHSLVADNVITGSLLDAIDLHGEGEYLNEIRGNTVVDGRRAGIALGNSGGSKHLHDASGEGNWVHSNELAGNREGVLVILGTPGTVIEDNRILAGAGSRAGVEVRNGPGTVVRGNQITGGTERFRGILLTGDQGADGRGAGVPSSVLVEGNTLRSTPQGIRIEAGDDVTVVDNAFSGVQRDEVSVADGATVDRR